MIIALDSETDKGLAILLTKPLAFAEPKSFEDCISFMASDREMACWNLDYDAQAVLKWLPRAVRDRIGLLHKARYGEYYITFVPHKYLQVTLDKEHRGKSRLLFTVYDLRQFYNCSLRRAAEKLGVQQKKDIPKSWYSQMRVRLADPRTRAKVLDYALGDAQTLQEIINKTVESFAAAGLKFERPFSNASFAKRYFQKKLGIRRHMRAERAAKKAYHGGRIECLKAGYFKRAFHYDIHSAYPSIIANLVKPDGKWIYERKPDYIRDDAIYAFVDCEFNIPIDEPIGPIPIRKRSGNIIYPTGRLRKTVTLTEFRYLERKGWVNRILSAWVHIWPKWKRPFAEIADIYTKRKSDPRIDYPFKIVMNSVYGILAEVLEDFKRTNRVDAWAEIFDGNVYRKETVWKKHTSFVYASEITAKIRMKLIEDFPPEVVIAYSTDGVFTTAEVPVKTGPDLGQWSEVEEVTDLIVVGSGVYTYREGANLNGDEEGERIIKFRGFSPDLDLEGMLYKAGTRHIVNQRVLRNTSIRLALKSSFKDRMNVLEEVTRSLDVNFDTKRHWPKRWTARELTEKQFDSKPWIYYGVLKLPRKGGG
jgi:DNA polymerase family B